MKGAGACDVKVKGAGACDVKGAGACDVRFAVSLERNRQISPSFAG